jgi:hypothetical protein
MSGLLAGKVWQSNLDSHLKPLAAAMADIANDDGTSIFPSVAYLAWLLGKGERSVQQGLSELKAVGVIEAVAFEKGGRNHPTEYRLIESALPNRLPWKELRKGATSAPFKVVKGAFPDIERVQSATQRVQLSTERVNCTAPDPSLDPLEEPSIDPAASADHVFVCWKETMDHPKARLDAKRRVLINKRLADGYSVDDLCIAIRGCRESDWHMGKNDRNTRYDDITLICRDAAHVDKFLEIAQGEGNGYRLRPLAVTGQDLERMMEQ